MPENLKPEVPELRELLKLARETLRDFATNWDCDSDAHKYGTTCRVCDARETLSKIDSAIAPGKEQTR